MTLRVRAIWMMGALLVGVALGAPASRAFADDLPARAAPTPDAVEAADIQAQVEFLRHKGFYGLRDPEERRAVDRLRAYRQKAGPALAELLAKGLKERSSGWIEVYRPLYILRGMGKASLPTLPSLIRALDDEHQINVNAAAQLLEELGPHAESAVPALIRAWERGKQDRESSFSSVGSALKKISPGHAVRLGIP